MPTPPLPKASPARYSATAMPSLAFSVEGLLTASGSQENTQRIAANASSEVSRNPFLEM